MAIPETPLRLAPFAEGVAEPVQVPQDLARLPFWYGTFYATGGAGLVALDPAGFRPRSWYTRHAVIDVGFMVTEAPPSIRGVAFLLRWSPQGRKAGSRNGPRNGQVVQ